MEAKEFHPLVELLLARMKSHPEEFAGSPDRLYPISSTPVGERWGYILTRAQEYATPEEEAAMKEALRSIKLDALHREAMDELLNGDERRRKVAEEQARYMSELNQNMVSASLNQPNPLNSLATATGVAQTNAQAKLSGLVNQIKRTLK